MRRERARGLDVCLRSVAAARHVVTREVLLEHLVSVNDNRERGELLTLLELCLSGIEAVERDALENVVHLKCF